MEVCLTASDGLGATSTRSVPLPCPDEGSMRATQLASAEAVHAHSGVVVTATCSLPPEGLMADALAHLRRLCDDAAIPIDPRVVTEADRVDDERIVGPHGRRIALPRRVRLFRQRSSIGEDLPIDAVVFVQHHQDVWGLDELQK